MDLLNETLTKARHTAEMLAKDIRQAHSIACEENPLLEILLLDLVEQIAKTETRLKRISLALQEQQNT